MSRVALIESRYEVEAIRDHEWRRKKGKNQPYVILYQVKWKGYPDSDNTLEPEENLLYVLRHLRRRSELTIRQ